MSKVSLRELVKKYELEIIELAQSGKGHSEIARELVQKHSIDLGSSHFDSLRRAISIHLSSPDPLSDYTELEEEIKKKFETESQITQEEINSQEQEEVSLAKSASSAASPKYFPRISGT